jgi:hypothetical protein
MLIINLELFNLFFRSNSSKKNIVAKLYLIPTFSNVVKMGLIKGTSESLNPIIF